LTFDIRKVATSKMLYEVLSTTYQVLRIQVLIEIPTSPARRGGYLHTIAFLATSIGVGH
jgi:hypothetical protein